MERAVDDVGGKLRRAREDAGLTATAAASLIGVHENTVYALETDAERRQVFLIRKACAVYGITMGFLFGEAEPRIPSEFRPLLEPLMPLDQMQREAVVKNIASNLSFMATVFAGSAYTGNGRAYDLPSNREGSKSVLPATLLEKTDELANVIAYEHAGDEPLGPAQRQRHRSAKKESHRK